MAKEAEKSLAKWRDRISVAKRNLEQVKNQNNWETYINEYEGKYDVVLGNQYVPPINEVFAYTQASIANLFYKNPYIAVNAKTTGSIKGAYILEAAVNHDWAELKMKDEVELEIMDTLHVGHGWNKVGRSAKTSGSGNNLKLESDKIYSNRVSWRDMLFNIGAKRPMVDALWMAQRIYRPTEDLKKEYGARASKLIGGSHPDVTEEMKKGMVFKDDVNFSAIWEVWDAREREILLFSDENSKDFLVDPRDWPSYLDEYPYQMLSFNEIPDKPYPMSDIAPWNAQILEKIKVFTMMLNHIKRWNRQLVARKGILSQLEMDKFEKGIDGTVLSATGQGDLQTAFKTLDFGSLPPDIYMILDRLDQIKVSVNGQPEFDRGGNTKTGTRTLGELQMIQGGSGARTSRKLDRIETHCQNIARQLLANIKSDMSVDRMVKITGNEPQEIIAAFKESGQYDPKSRSIRFRADDIAGEYDCSVKAGSTLALDKETRDQILDSVLQTSVQLASAPTLPPFIAEIIKERLRDYEIKSLEVAFDEQQKSIAQKDQGAAMDQEAIVAKTESETAKRRAQAQQIEVDTTLKTAQALGKASGMLHPELSLTQ